MIDGDAQLRVALATALGAEGHEVELAAAVTTGMLIAKSSVPDLIILGAMLSGMTAAEAVLSLRRERTNAAALLLVVGSSGAESDRVAAFEAGADDYVVTPFSTRELLLRVRALLRRARAKAPAESIRVGSLTIERLSRRVTVEGARVSLTRREFDLLMRLVDGRGRVITRGTLVAELWPDDAPSSRVVDTTLKRLRRKLPAIAARLRTIRGVGYELGADDGEERADSSAPKQA
ncbi:MAG: response regulator transcription factor [Labilithrix sp.]|nr:response regulator transcription factor [Labilithrix sp.]